MMVRVLYNDIGPRSHRLANDTLIKRVIPGGCRRYHDAILAEGLGQLLEMFLLVGDDFAASFLERWRIEQPVTAQVFIVVTNQ